MGRRVVLVATLAGKLTAKERPCGVSRWMGQTEIQWCRFWLLPDVAELSCNGFSKVGPRWM